MNKLDNILVKCLELILSKNNSHNMVAAALVTKDGVLYGTSEKSKNKSTHAERGVIEEYISKHGSIPSDAILVITLSPCFEPMSDRNGDSCCKLIDEVGIKMVYVGLDDWTQEDYDKHHYNKEPFKMHETTNAKIKKTCAKLLNKISKTQEIAPSIDTKR